MQENFYYGTGRRKSAVARTRLMEGSGRILINGQPVEEYFPRETLRMIINQPFDQINQKGAFDVKVNVTGGGISGQAEAVRHGISRALLEYDPELRKTLKSAGLLTRDAREKERKKYGQPGARAKFQYSKR
jgi:small subunit ribosomal protein S9